jgi:hypothetical protein
MGIMLHNASEEYTILSNSDIVKVLGVWWGAWGESDRIAECFKRNVGFLPQRKHVTVDQRGELGATQTLATF